jgi:hypothetical protein
MGAILSFPDRTLLATLSGGSWSSSYPLGNLQDDQLSVKARSSNALAASTTILVDLGATARAIRCIGVLSHNISFAGTIRARGYSDSGYTSLVSGADSGTQYAYPQSITEEQASQYPDHWIYAFSTSKTARYWKIEITDTANAAGWIEIGRLWIGEGNVAPAVGLSYGASLGYECRDIISESVGGAVWGDTRTSRRVSTVSFGALQGAEKQQALIMQKVLGKTGELLYIMNTEDTAIDMIMQAFPATLRSVNPIQYPFFNLNELPVEVVEILNNSNVTYSMGGSAANVKARE